jgi:membrane-bound lytic murein transglycosylase A
LLFASLALAGCSTSIPAREALGDDIDDLDPPSLALAAERTAAALEGSSPRRDVTIGGHDFSRIELMRSARHVARVAREESDPARLSRRLANECRAYPADAEAKVTGYYEPVLDARREPDQRFRYPIYGAPSPAQLDVLRARLGRVPTRADIDGSGALDGMGLELAWVDDPVARFFLQVQGSGRLRFADGREQRVGFAATNELPYRSVGAAMLEQGLLEPGNASATAMRKWLAAHPDRRDALLELNPRYVFFRDTGTEGPFGALGTVLVAGRSIASDDHHVPRGVLAWLRTTRPVVGADGTLQGKKPLTRFVFAQDAGAAIQGQARVDLFVGSGEEAGVEAGGMNEAGRLYVLMCRAPAVPGGPAGRPGRSWQHLRAP